LRRGGRGDLICVEGFEKCERDTSRRRYSEVVVCGTSDVFVAMESGENTKNCAFHKRGRDPCRRLCISALSDYCIIHQPLSSDHRLECIHCHQLIKDHALNKHLRICSKKQPEQSYYQESINDPSRVIPQQPGETETSEVDLMNLVAKIQQLHDSYLEPMLGPRRKTGDRKSIQHSEKHRIQELLIYNSMKCHDIIPQDPYPDTAFVFLDLGSGKGSLSKTISLQEIPQNSSFICVEKAHYKHKAERGSFSSTSTGATCSSYRAQIDLRDVDLKELINVARQRTTGDVSSENHQVQVIGMGKHLCGNATDTAIISLANLLSSPQSSSTDSMGQSSSSPTLRGICIALCCHSNCQWNSSLCSLWFNSESLPIEQRILPTEWEYLRKWSGMFALNEKEVSLDQTKEKENEVKLPSFRGGIESLMLSYADRVCLGRMCKRLIDFGRIEYLRKELHMNATLVYYTEEDVTPENVLLIAWRDQDGPIESSLSEI
jgi:tRNA:m4X modification enzyme